MTQDKSFETIVWREDAVVMLDQLRLPHEEVYERFESPEAVAEAIRRMVIRGAPAIGIAAAMGMALATRTSSAHDTSALLAAMDAAGELMAGTRPTAVNLFWAIERMRQVGAANATQPPEAFRARMLEEAQAILDEDIAANRAIGRYGAELLPATGTVLTHCNAGALATGGYGTALGVIRAAVEAGKKLRVFADETRPYLQGARLTAWELMRDGIDTTVITDNMAGWLMRQGEIDAVVVGSDRIIANGDVANKIGTYALSVLCRENGVPFYVAAPTSTVDMSLQHGDDIAIEERSADEVVFVGGQRIAPEGVGVRHPAFDVTPNRYVTAIITENGVARPPYRETLRELLTT